MKTLLLALVLCACVTTGCAEAQPIVRHEGSNDPTTEGWKKYRSFTNVGTSPVKNDLGIGIRAWTVYDNGGQDGVYGYSFDQEQLEKLKSTGWKLTTKLRIVDAQEEGSDGAIMVGVAFNGRSYIMGFRNTKDGYPIIDLGRRGLTTRIVLDDLDKGYHTYELIFDPIDNCAKLVVDGAVRAQGYSGLDEVLNNVGDLYFGSTASDDKGKANYSSVKFEAIARP